RSGLADPELRSSFMATLGQVYELEIDVLMRLHRVRPEAGFAARAFRLSESAHARSLLDLLAEAGARPRPGRESQLARRERELRLKLNAKAARQAMVGPAENAVLAKQIDGLSAELRAVQSELRLRNPRYAALQPQPLDWPQVQGQLLDDATVL